MKTVKSNFAIFIASSFLFACSTPSKPAPVLSEAPASNPVSYGKDIERREASPSVYKTQGTCNGLPRLLLKTAPGFCVGLVDSGEGLTKPRYTLAFDDTNLLLTDMGGWKVGIGKLHLLTRAQQKWTRKLLLDATNIAPEKKCILDRPHQLIRGPDNKVYITSAQCVATISWPLARNPSDSIEIKIAQLPTSGIHPLKSITFDNQGDILMNVGSITDNCELETTDTCRELLTEEGRGVIRKYTRLNDGSYDSRFEIFASGQRNSVALHWDSQNQNLWAGENARDYIERKDTVLNGLEKPSDEFNIISRGDQLDWPYCYDQGKPSPEFPRSDCSIFKKPHLLFPAHSAPLSFLFHSGKQFPKWYRNRLLVSFHGYATYGHRIVTYKRNDRLEPVGEPLSLVYGWEAQSGQSVGSPVGLTEAPDGSVFITEDTSQKVLQLFYDPKLGAGEPVGELKIGTGHVDSGQLAQDLKRAEEKRRLVMEQKLKQREIPLFTLIQSKVIDQNCTACHGGVSYPGIQILKYDDVGNYKKLKDQLWHRLRGDGIPQMPPGGLMSGNKDELMMLVKKWFDAGSPAP